MRAFAGVCVLMLVLGACATGSGFDEAATIGRFGRPEAHIVSEPPTPIGEVLRLNDLSEIASREDLKDRYFAVEYAPTVKADYGLGIVVTELRYGPDRVVAREYRCLVGPYVAWYRVPKLCDYRGEDIVAFARAHTVRPAQPNR